MAMPVTNFQASPMPDYGDWFEEVQRLALRHRIEVRTEVLPVEASRGCWWGQHAHCIFCGIDEEALKYRYKPSGAVLAMLI